MREHYKGPWTIHVGDKGSGPWDRTTIEAGPEHGRGVIATVNVMIPTGQANARLIAAAPDLYEALLDATAHLAGAASAYRKHASRHRSVGRSVADPFFTTRADDFDKAVERVRNALAIAVPSPDRPHVEIVDVGAPLSGTKK